MPGFQSGLLPLPIRSPILCRRCVRQEIITSEDIPEVKQLLLALITVFILCCPAFGQTIYTASRTTTYAWDQPDQVENGVMGWKIILVRNVTGEQFVFLSNVAQITIAPNALDSTAKRLKSGDYEVRVSALNVDGESGHCSSADANDLVCNGQADRCSA